MSPRKFLRERKLLSTKNVDKAFRASTISYQNTSDYPTLSQLFAPQETKSRWKNALTLSLSSLVSKILFNFLDKGLFGWDSLLSAILEIFYVAQLVPGSPWNTGTILGLGTTMSLNKSFEEELLQRGLWGLFARAPWWGLLCWAEIKLVYSISHIFWALNLYKVIEWSSSSFRSWLRTRWNDRSSVA